MSSNTHTQIIANNKLFPTPSKVFYFSHHIFYIGLCFFLKQEQIWGHYLNCFLAPPTSIQTCKIYSLSKQKAYTWIPYHPCFSYHHKVVLLSSTLQSDLRSKSGSYCRMPNHSWQPHAFIILFHWNCSTPNHMVHKSPTIDCSHNHLIAIILIYNKRKQTSNITWFPSSTPGHWGISSTITKFCYNSTTITSILSFF